jgi:hypothetical protein
MWLVVVDRQQCLQDLGGEVQDQKGEGVEMVYSCRPLGKQAAWVIEVVLP